MKKRFNPMITLLLAGMVAACSGTRTAADTTSENPITDPQASANLNTQNSPTGLTSAGVQSTVDTTTAMFPVNGKGELSDQSFIDLAANAGMKEIELSKLAQQNGQTDDVKKFARMMVNDHTVASNELKTVASTLNMTISPQPDTLVEHNYKLAADQLSKLPADKFDRAYLAGMLKDHRRAVALYDLGTRSKQPQIKAYAEKYLPKLRNHLAEVEKLTR